MKTNERRLGVIMLLTSLIFITLGLASACQPCTNECCTDGCDGCSAACGPIESIKCDQCGSGCCTGGYAYGPPGPPGAYCLEYGPDCYGCGGGDDPLEPGYGGPVFMGGSCCAGSDVCNHQGECENDYNCSECEVCGSRCCGQVTGICVPIGTRYEMWMSAQPSVPQSPEISDYPLYHTLLLVNAFVSAILAFALAYRLNRYRNMLPTAVLEKKIFENS